MSIHNFAVTVAKKAGKLILEKSQKPLKIERKAPKDLVTNVDKAAEKLIIKEILGKYPNHGIIAEESMDKAMTPAELAKKKYIWIIDPIDGTTNFTHNLPLYAVSIGVFKLDDAEKSKNFEYLSGELVAGVVFAPALKELFSAEKGKGAFLNGTKIKVSKVKKASDCLSVTGFPPKHREMNLPFFHAMLKKSQAIRRLGAASLDLCYIACGRFDSYWEFGLKPWDIAAGALIIEEAGGTITDSFGNPLDLFGKDILATNGHLHKEIVNTFKKL